MQSIVADTNVIVSAAISEKGKPSQIMGMVSDGRLRLCYNMRILSEYIDVLSREKFGFSLDKQMILKNKIVETGFVVDPIPSNILIPDENDRIFYDTAKEAGAILVTGNIKHYPAESFIMTPADFLVFVATVP